jgi:putative ubiquitin-RnfH superfamily antitoxin RatB of RatAB toxin-antitoxin module
MESADGAQRVSVTVAYSPRAGSVDEVALSLAGDATVLDALRASGLLQRHPSIDLARQRVGVWGKPADLGEALRDRDRVEIYRPLSIDPKEARRLRDRRQRERDKR